MVCRKDNGTLDDWFKRAMEVEEEELLHHLLRHKTTWAFRTWAVRAFILGMSFRHRIVKRMMVCTGLLGIPSKRKSIIKKMIIKRNTIIIKKKKK